ncbi:MAG: hypothetical protein H6733_15300 [Alphaproteobacteria bacterium]|nr:hypothetical protein [Alphaproteobacteria bacterium]
MLRPPVGLCLVLAACSAGTPSDDADTHSADTDDTEPVAPGVPSTLIDHDAWVRDDGTGDTDPFPTHRPDTVVCGVDGFYREGEGVDVDTRKCTYLVASQPSLAAVHAGDRVRTFFYNNGLIAEEPAEAHVAIALGDHVIFDEHIPIPSEAAPFNLDAEVDADAPIGTPVVLHLHNHGYNTWRLMILDVVPGLPPG